eukprot:Platyproteum_vivax@DN9825_c0_g1_i1.p1
MKVAFVIFLLVGNAMGLRHRAIPHSTKPNDNEILEKVVDYALLWSKASVLASEANDIRIKVKNTLTKINTALADLNRTFKQERMSPEVEIAAEKGQKNLRDVATSLKEAIGQEKQSQLHRLM